MIRFKAKHLVDRGFSQHLVGDSSIGEQELIIVVSWGDDNKSALVIIAASAEGLKVLHSSSKRVILANVLATLDRVIEKWSRDGVKPGPDMKAKSDRQRKKLLDRLADLYEFGETKKQKKEKKKKKKGVRDEGAEASFMA